MSDSSVSVTYKGAEIANINESGTTTLKTAGTYCEDDIGLVAQISGGGGTDISLDITGASVGQIAKITAVDADGKPTAWTPVDMPTSLRSPNALTIKIGDTTVTYDGSEAKTVEISNTGGAIVGTIDSENNITLTGALDDGTYTLVYELEDGTTTEIGTLTVGGSTAYTNLFDPSTVTLNVRWSNSAYSIGSTANGYVASGFIPVTVSSDSANPTVMRFRGATMAGNASIVYYNSAQAVLADPNASTAGADANCTKITVTTDENGDYQTNLGWKSGAFISTWANAAYIRVVLQVNSTSTALTEADIQNIIITLNEPIV